MRRLAFVWTFLLLGQEPVTWTPGHQMKFTGIGDVTPSPDGKLVVWTQREAVMSAEKSEFRTHLFLARADRSTRVQLTRGDKSATSPRFTPDGRWVVFTSDRAGKPNLYRISVTGGEAEQLTDWKGTLTRYEVSPDGKQVAFTGTEEDKDAEKRRKEKLDYKVIDDKPRHSGLWVFPVDGEFPAKPRSLAAGDFHVTAFGWAPDSSRLAYVRVPRPDADLTRHADIVEAELADGKTRELAKTSDTEDVPHYSPDGRWLAYLRQPSQRQAGAEVRVVLYNRADGSTRELAKTPDERPGIIGWMADSRAVLIEEVERLKGRILRLPIDGPVSPLRVGPQGTLAQARLNTTGTHVGFRMETPDEPPEAFVAALDAAEAVRVSAANTATARPAIGKTEAIRWGAADGLEIDGLLTYPVDYRQGRSAPLIVNIHGGPSGVFTAAFEGGPGLYPLATFSAKGYAVLRSNPRGSTGRGAAFRRRVVEDWGGLDFQDIMAGVDHLIRSGVADPERMAVMGWSYGGYMTAWTVTQTARFKAAAIGAGITDHVSMYGTQDIPTTYEDYFGGAPWEKPEAYARSSPIRFVQNVKTPTLLLHGENDARVPPTQAQEFYRALKRQGVPARMIVYPRQGHGPSEPKFQQHIMEEHLAWVEKYLGRAE
jgi:dipeptidyl aminopeptidase/acylaminoacyl peptidase